MRLALAGRSSTGAGAPVADGRIYCLVSSVAGRFQGDFLVKGILKVRSVDHGLTPENLRPIEERVISRYEIPYFHWRTPFVNLDEL